MNQLSGEKRKLILHLLVEGLSIRSICRVVGVSKSTVTKLLIDGGKACQKYHDKKVRRLNSLVIQCDEIWSFIYLLIHEAQQGCRDATYEPSRFPVAVPYPSPHRATPAYVVVTSSDLDTSRNKASVSGLSWISRFIYAKDKNLHKCIAAPVWAGTAWAWTAIDGESKLIISYRVGDRSADTAIDFMQDVESRLLNRVQITTDGHPAYRDAVIEAFDGDVDFAQLVKTFDDNCPGINLRAVEGNPQEKDISTSFVERQNLTMRMGMRRFNRKTNAHSKKLENHCYMISLYFVYYNFIRIHETLGTTPAQAAGVSKKIRDLDWLVRLIDKNASTPNRPKRYMTKKKRRCK